MSPDGSIGNKEMNACVDINDLIAEPPHIRQERQRLAEMMGCVTEEQVSILAGVELSTVRAWRNRRTGPQHIPFGNARLYPVELLKAFLTSLATSIDCQTSPEPIQAISTGRRKPARENRKRFVDMI